MVTLLRLAACSVPLLIGLTSRCFVPQFAIVALLRYRLQVSFAHWTSASPVSRTARGEAPSHWARASCAPRHYHPPQFAIVVLHLRTVPSSAARCFASADFASLCVLEASAASRPPMKAELPCLLGLLRPVSATGGGLRASHQFPLKSYGFPGAETAKKRFLLWKMGFSGAKIAPSPPYTPPGTIKAREGLGPSRALPWDFLTVWVIIFPGEGT